MVASVNFAALLVIRTVSATTLSTSYDAAKLNAYFAAKPGVLAARAAELAGIAASTTAMLVAAAAKSPPASASEFWARDGTSAAVAAAVEGGWATFAKFGQAAASRPDLITPPLARALRGLQERMAPFAGGRAAVEKALRATKNPPAMVEEVLATLSTEPVAAASVGQVYRAKLGKRSIAIKVRRPQVLETVAADAALVRGAAGLLQPLVRTDLVGACDEFFSRLFEECDYGREVANARLFRDLYGLGVGTATASLPKIGGLRGVIVPEMVEALCGESVVTMDWVDGGRLDGVLDGGGDRGEDLALLELGIRCTLSQLLETGILHADPHGGNLRKVRDGTACRLAYLDFGLLATVPENVRDGLVCAVALLCFSRDIDAVALLFGELMLLPPEVLEDPTELAALRTALAATVDDVLVFSEGREPPVLKFDRLLDALARLVPRFDFQLPPYFANNARAIDGLEGMAKSLDPDFNILSVVYPYALGRLLRNPSASPVVADTLRTLVTTDGLLDRRKARALLRDAAELAGVKRRRVLLDTVRAKQGRRFVRELLRARRPRPRHALDGVL